MLHCTHIVVYQSHNLYRTVAGLFNVITALRRTPWLYVIIEVLYINNSTNGIAVHAYASSS